MELNHQIRFCRPFPFRFGFRAVLNSLARCNESNRGRGELNTLFSRAQLQVTRMKVLLMEARRKRKRPSDTFLLSRVFTSVLYLPGY